MGLLVWRFCSANKLITGPWATDKLEAVPVIGALYNFYGEDTLIKLFYDLYTSIHVERSWRCSSCWWHRIVWLVYLLITSFAGPDNENPFLEDYLVSSIVSYQNIGKWRADVNDFYDYIFSNFNKSTRVASSSNAEESCDVD